MNISGTVEVNFNNLPLQESLQKALSSIGFSCCTAIQAESLPIMLNGKDVAGQAQTGTGKTAAFLLATMNQLLDKDKRDKLEHPYIGALVISPTRELAIQIHKDAQQLSKFTELKSGLVYGGVDYIKQKQMLSRGVDILIGTPGRLIDFYKQKLFNLSKTSIVVLDEADRMFDLGFIRDIRYLLRRLPKPQDRLSMLFSATLSHRVTELAYEHMNNPKLIRINPEQVAAENISHTMYHISNDEKIPLLLGILKRIDAKRTIIFVNTKRIVERVWGYLEGNGYHAAMLSGDVPQKTRQRLFKEFSSGKLPILVATDLASRGLHIPDVSHIINFDMPQNAEDYVHRIGRTARAGASGDAVSLVCEEFVYSLHEIEEYIGHKIPIEPVTKELLITPAARVRSKFRSHTISNNKPRKKPDNNKRRKQR